MLKSGETLLDYMRFRLRSRLTAVFKMEAWKDSFCFHPPAAQLLSPGGVTDSSTQLRNGKTSRSEEITFIVISLINGELEKTLGPWSALTLL